MAIQDLSNCKVISENEPLTVAITGGCGSLGHVLAEMFVENNCTVRLIDIDEHKLSMVKHPLVRPIHCDIRDMDKMRRALIGVEILIHCAAMKNLNVSEYNPDSLVDVNVNGTLSVLNAAAESGVESAWLVSTDKAVEPTTAYGASKLLGERLWLWGNQIFDETSFSVFRSGNFFNSAGNVIEVWDRLYHLGEPLPITHTNMRRHFIDTKDAARALFHAAYRQDLHNVVVVPRMHEKTITNLARELYPDCELKFIGVRPGEKLRELLINANEERILEEELYVVYAV